MTKRLEHIVLGGTGGTCRIDHVTRGAFARLIPHVGAGGRDHEKRQGNLFHERLHFHIEAPEHAADRFERNIP